MKGITPQTAMGSPLIEQVVIEAVYPEKRVCDVTGVVTQRNLQNVPYFSPFVSASGLGFDYCPRAGMLAYVCTPADASGSFIFCFSVSPTNASEELGESLNTGYSYAGNRDTLKQDEISIRGPGKSRVKFHRGGALSVGVSPLCATHYFPIQNLLRVFFSALDVQSPVGDLNWGFIELESTAEDTEYPVLLRLNARDKVGSTASTLELRVGSLLPDALDAAVSESALRAGKPTRVNLFGETVEVADETPASASEQVHLFGAAFTGLAANGRSSQAHSGLLSMVLNTAEAQQTVVLQLAGEGGCILKTKQLIHLETPALSVEVEEEVKVRVATTSGIEINTSHSKLFRADSSLELSEPGNVTVRGTVIQLEAEDRVEIRVGSSALILTSTGVVVEGPGLLIGGAGASMDLAANYEGWSATLTAHNHPVSGPAAGPSAIDPLATAVSTRQTTTKLLIK